MSIALIVALFIGLDTGIGSRSAIMLYLGGRVAVLRVSSPCAPPRLEWGCVGAGPSPNRGRNRGTKGKQRRGVPTLSTDMGKGESQERVAHPPGRGGRAGARRPRSAAAKRRPEQRHRKGQEGRIKVVSGNSSREEKLT
ncbi:hypothetical protein T484DRAFT_2295986 [Baffinella frigidus]|nr:hypothetical protein T484DRAFT_2295986 [Cryptophyta sp. CCMP2293]